MLRLKVLEDYCQILSKNKEKIIKENIKDVQNIKRKHLVDRLVLNEKRIDGIINSIRLIANLKVPWEEYLKVGIDPKLKITKFQLNRRYWSNYESRPNVTADVAS